MAADIRSYRDLIAWQKGVQLCKRIYEVSGHFPDAEKFGLISQLRRAAVSVPSNIAEGYGRHRTQDYIRFLDLARASLAEIDTQLTLACELGFTDGRVVGPCNELVGELSRILYALAKSINDKEES